MAGSLSVECLEAWCARGKRNGLMAFTSVLTWAGALHAQSEASREVVMAYKGELGCPSEATFSAGLSRLMPRLIIAGGEVANPGIEVVFERRDNGFVGRLSFGDTRREVTAELCADAAYALAVVTAITLDPETSVVQSQVVPADFVESEPIATPAVAQPKPSQNKPKQRAPASLERPVQSAARARPLEPARREREWSVWGGPRGALGQLGAFAWGGGLAVLTVGETTLASYRFAARGMSAQRDLDVTTVSYVELGVQMAWCPLLEGSQRWSLRICTGGEASWERVSARETSAFDGRRPSGEYGFGVSLDLDGLFAINRRWSLALGPGMIVPVIRPEYVVVSGSGGVGQVVKHAPVVVTGGMQVGYAFD
jgi:hypothetical protein